jgi:ABC-type Fe3+-citrate transport system substrate-binding protein
MKTEIENFNKAFADFIVAEMNLDRMVEVELKKICPLLKRKRQKETAINALYALIDTLPKHYKGKRRIYELIEKYGSDLPLFAPHAEPGPITWPI